MAIKLSHGQWVVVILFGWGLLYSLLVPVWQPAPSHQSWAICDDEEIGSTWWNAPNYYDSQLNEYVMQVDWRYTAIRIIVSVWASPEKVDTQLR